MPLVGTGIGSTIGSQDAFEGLLGYSIKREYFGDSFNYRNVETFTYDIYVTDLANVIVDDNTGTCSDPAYDNDKYACKTWSGTWTLNPTFGRNYLSTFINNEISSLLNVDKNNINVISIEVPNSDSGKENLITLGTYRVKFEIRQKIGDDVLWKGYCDGGVGANAAICAADGGSWASPQHAELNPATANLNKFKNLQKVFEDYGEHVSGLNESIDIERGEDGSKTISHNVSMDARDGVVNGVNTQARLIAQGVAYDLLSSMNFTNAWGINLFTNASKDFGFVNKFLSAKNHRFTESYDLLANKYSFTRKTKVLAREEDPNTGARTKRYTQNSKYSIQVSESGDITVSEDMQIVSQTRDLRQVKRDIKRIKERARERCRTEYHRWMRNTPNAPLGYDTFLDHFFKTSCTTNMDERSRTVTISTTFTNANIAGLSGADLRFWDTDITVGLEKDDKGTSSLDFSVDLKFVSSHDLHTQDRPDQQEQNKDKKDTVGSGPNFHSDVIEQLIYYDGATPNYVLEHYHNNTANSIDEFWQNNPNLLDFNLDGEVVAWGQAVKAIVPNPTEWTLLNKNATSKTRGKAYSLKKKWTDDPVYIKSLPGCINCFKKIEPKIADSYPQNVFSEHIIVNRQVLRKGPRKNWNSPNSSVLSYGYNSGPGKRSVTLNAIIPRRMWNVLLPSDAEVDMDGGAYVPIKELKALATYARVLLMQVFFDSERLSGTQFAGHLSSLSYTFDSTGNLTLSAEMAYGYKQYNPNIWAHLPMKYKK